MAPSILGVTEDSADQEVTVTINNPISLICEALAFPAPTITWMKDGSPFEASNNIQLLPGDALGGGARGQRAGPVKPSSCLRCPWPLLRKQVPTGCRS